MADGPRASRWEILGAWLHLWTPPRDVEVPPLTGRVVGIAVGVVALIGLAVVLVAPFVDRGKDEAAAERRAVEAQRARAARERTIAEQRPRTASAPALRPADDSATRARLLARVEAAITVDARRRVAAGELEQRTGDTRCRPAARAGEPLRDMAVRVAAFDCLATTATIAGTDRNAPGRLGYPFRAVVDFERARFAWCKTNPVPGEKLIPDPRRIVALPAVCRGGR